MASGKLDSVTVMKYVYLTTAIVAPSAAEQWAARLARYRP